jgi:hypothetical protein
MGDQAVEGEGLLDAKIRLLEESTAQQAVMSDDHHPCFEIMWLDYLKKRMRSIHGMRFKLDDEHQHGIRKVFSFDALMTFVQECYPGCRVGFSSVTLI